MKRLLVLVAVLAPLSWFMAGCGGSPGTTPEEQQQIEQQTQEEMQTEEMQEQMKKMEQQAAETE